MSETLLLPPDVVAPRRKAWRAWKAVGLAVWALVLVFGKWLPQVVVVLGHIFGIVVLLNLAFLGAKYLKNRFFWRVRNRIAGSLVFVGLIPLLLMLGTVFLGLYLLAGQLSARLVEQALADNEEELSELHAGLAERLAGATEQNVVAALAAMPADRVAHFPALAVRLARREADGTFTVLAWHDPAGFLPSRTRPYPAQKWLRPDGTYRGLLVWERVGLIAVARPLARTPGVWLDVVAPLDERLCRRLLKERSLYVSFGGIGTTRVRVDSKGMQIDTDKGTTQEEVAKETEKMASALEAERARDSRRMVTWIHILSGRDYLLGKADAAGFALVHVPVSVLYQSYIGGGYEQGRVILTLLFVLCALFASALLVSVIVGVTISRRVTKSVDDMYRGILALQKGDLEHRIPVRKDDQLGLLAHSFNQMTGSITRLLSEVAEKKRLEQELEIAREVQATLFPKQLPKPRGLEIFGGCEPAMMVSGDYYDFIVEDEARLHIVVGDISGKGISAALLMANLQAAMRSQLLRLQHGQPGHLEQDLSELMSRLNGQVFANSPSGKYATLFTARYDAETRRLCYCNAGHLPPIVFGNEATTKLEAGGTVLGLFENASYPAASVTLEPGNLLAIYTDGVTEAMNAADEEFGEHRLIDAIRASRMKSSQEIYTEVTGRLREWQGGPKQHDDITLIIARVY